MDDFHLIINDTARKILEKHVTQELLREGISGPRYAAFWTALEQAGLDRITIGEDAGGAGLSPHIALSVIRLFAWFAAPGPFAETLLAGWIATYAGLEIPEGPITLALGNKDLRLFRDAGGWRVSGEAADVPWGRGASVLLVTEEDDQTVIVLLPQNSAHCTPGLNIAGEPRDQLIWNVVLPAESVKASVDGLTLQVCRALGAAVRVAQMAGASERICEMTIEHVRQRVQFGKPLASFQAIQQSLAQIATAAAATAVGADRAAQAFALEEDSWKAAAVGKIRAGEAATLIGGLSHQLHGAIGFTEEYQLHWLTKRVWAWRNEFGGESEWAQSYGQSLIAAGADHLWSNFVQL